MTRRQKLLDWVQAECAKERKRCEYYFLPRINHGNIGADFEGVLTRLRPRKIKLPKGIV